MNPYYIVVEEWNYPTESGREVCDLTFDSLEEAIAKCKEFAGYAEQNFEDNVKQDVLPPAITEDKGKSNGVIITTRTGLDPFYYYARVITMEPLHDLTYVAMQGNRFRLIGDQK